MKPLNEDNEIYIDGNETLGMENNFFHYDRRGQGSIYCPLGFFT